MFSDFACLNVFLICIKKCLNENSAAYVMTCGDEVDAVDLSMKSKWWFNDEETDLQAAQVSNSNKSHTGSNWHWQQQTEETQVGLNTQTVIREQDTAGSNQGRLTRNLNKNSNPQDMDTFSSD